MVPLPQYPVCVVCPLHANSKNPGLATRAYAGNQGRDTALLILGKAPAYEEDKKALVFVGDAGVYCDRVYIKAFRLTNYADVFLQNVVRCRLPHPDMAVPTGSVSGCRPYLEADVREIAKCYREVVVLCVGPDAAKSVLRSAVNFNTFDQGILRELGGVPVRVFATYNPAILGEGKDPSKVLAIQDHLELLREYLTHKELRYQLKDLQYRKGEPLPETIDGGLLSLDTETYGAIAGYPEQRFFNPAKCIALDSVQREDLVQVGSIACRTKGELWACSYDLKNSKELSNWQSVSKRLEIGTNSRASNEPGLTLLGQNVPFDLSMLRAWSPIWKASLSPYALKMEELMVWNFLENDQRPERSLKPLSKLLGITSYSSELNLKKGERYESSSDPRLHLYAAKDALATLVARNVLRDRIEARFGGGSPKISRYSQEWFSALIWLCVELGESGIRYDLRRLMAAMGENHRRIEQTQLHLQERHGLILAGKGSPASKADFVLRCFQDLDLGLPKRTKVRGDVAADDENLGTILDNGDPKHPLHAAATLWGEHTTCSKLEASYYIPMLGLKEKRKGRKATKPSKKNPLGKPAIPPIMDLRGALVGDTAYPTWYPVPSYMSLGGRKDQQQQGGTRQARIVAQNHGAQTEPPAIWGCMTSRYGPEGMVVYRDGSQIELRVGGALSKDPEMLAVYTALPKRNFHAESASKLFGFSVNKLDNPAHYHSGKTANFLRLFRGGAKKLQSTILKENKIELTLEHCQEFLDADKLLFPRFYAWQDELIERAITYGFLETPLVGISRSFLGGRTKILATYVPDICNVLVQAVAAMLIQSAQVELQRRIAGDGGRRIHLVKNVYDAGYYDLHASEYDWWVTESGALYDSPPYLAALRESGHWAEMPLESETKIVYNGPVDRNQ